VTCRLVGDQIVDAALKRKSLEDTDGLVSTTLETCNGE